MIRRRTLVGAAGASLLAAPALGPAFGQGAFPNKPLKVVVPYPPGGGTDGLGRITCQFLSEKLGQPIVVQNIGGASGTVGSETGAARRSRRLYAAVQCEPVRAGQDGGADLSLRSADRLPGDRPGGRSAAGADPCNNNVPGTDYASTIAAIAKEPKKYFFALSSGGSAGHIATLAFLKRTGLPLDTILYKGTAPANADIDGGQRPALHGSVDGDVAARHLRPGARPVRHLQGAHAACAQHPDLRRSRPEGLQHQLLVRPVGAQGHARSHRRQARRAMAEVSKDPPSSPRPRRSASCRRRADPRNSPPSSRPRSRSTRRCLKESGFKPE